MSRHAETTKVPVAQSRSEIDKLLRTWECDGVRWTDHFGDQRAVLEFVWTIEGSGPMLARFEISGAAAARDPEQEWRRVHRVLRVFLLGIFNAVEAQIISFEEAVLPWTVAANGQTVAQALLPRLREIPSGDAVALLEANLGA